MCRSGESPTVSRQALLFKKQHTWRKNPQPQIIFSSQVITVAIAAEDFLFVFFTSFVGYLFPFQQNLIHESDPLSTTVCMA